MSAQCAAAGVYRPRSPRTTPLYRLVEAHYDEVKGQWEERFEGRYGYWRGFVDEQVRRYLDCGLYENGFARIRCPDCRAEYLLAFSCKTRELCPSCAAKRAAVTAALLCEEVLEEVGHSQWVFVMPKMLRLYFLHHRELLGKLARAAWETVLDLMIEATGEESLRPGMVAVVQTAGDLGNWHPHVHALVSRGGWTRDREWERTRLLLSWRHTGFSVHIRVRVEPEDGAAVERLARYIMRPPISLERLDWGGVGEVRYRGKQGHDGGSHHMRALEEALDPAEFLARVIVHIPEPRRHLVRYYGAYSNASRGRRKRLQQELGIALPGSPSGFGNADRDQSPDARALRRRWAEMIKRVFEVDPLVCPRCQGEMRIVAFIVDPKVVDRILRHLRARDDHRERGPPEFVDLEAAS
jgi:hypothetical protein